MKIFLLKLSIGKFILIEKWLFVTTLTPSAVYSNHRFEAIAKRAHSLSG